MGRYRTTRWISAASLAVALLPGCADVIAEQRSNRSDPRAAGATAVSARGESRGDRRAYYAYSRSVWAEIQGDLDAAVMWSREAIRVGDQETPVFFSAVTGEGVPELWRAVEAMLGAPLPRPAGSATGAAPQRRGAPNG